MIGETQYDHPRGTRESSHTTIKRHIHSNSKTSRKVMSSLIQGMCRSSRTNRVIKVTCLGDSTG